MTHKTTRRHFLKQSGFTLMAVGLSREAFYHNLGLAANSTLTQAAALSPTDRILVVVQLAGGNDGINTVIPLNGSLSATYRQRRPTLAVAPDQVLPVGTDSAGNQLGFHPRLPKFKALMDQGHLGVIQAVGYPNPNRSHFESMAIWHTANPVRPDGTGWLGDYLDVAYPSNDNPLIGVYLGGTLPLGLKAREVIVPAISNFETYRFQTDSRFPQDAGNRINAFLALNREAAPEQTYREIIRQVALDAYQSAEQLQTGIRRYTPDPAIQYPSTNPLARVMQMAAQIIAGGLGTKILYVTLGGFDTHQTQNGPNGQGGQPLLLQYLDDAVDAFYRDMQRLGVDDKVLIMTWSEFGRKVGENGNRGTDHGASGPQFVIGTPVRGGLFGVYPSLTDLDRDDGTKFSIDFRSIYATILERWLGVSSRELLGGTFELLNFLS